MSNKEKLYIIKVVGEVQCFAENEESAIKEVEEALEIMDWNSETTLYLSINDESVLELDQDMKDALDIIAKAFEITSEKFLTKIIKDEIFYIKDNLDPEAIESVLETHYHVKINKKQLRKLL